MLYNSHKRYVSSQQQNLKLNLDSLHYQMQGEMCFMSISWSLKGLLLIFIEYVK